MTAPELTPGLAGAERSGAWRRVRSGLIESGLVGVAGIALALAANVVSPRGLTLGRNYFPRASESASTTVSGLPATNSTGGHLATETVAARLAARGLTAIDLAEADALFRDPRREQEMIVFVDARHDAAYQAGHIPGAHQFDRYYPERYLPSVLPACDAAEVVVVYCTGGNCEDSEFAAAALLDAGIAIAKVKVFVAGMDAWREQGLPVELGARGSGQLRPATP